MSFFDKFQSLLSRIQSGKGKPAFQKYHSLVIAIIIGYIIADLGVLYFRPQMLPTEAPPSQQKKTQVTTVKTLADYNNITRRNIFNEDGVIPPPLGDDATGPGEIERPAVPSQLPIQLLGTIVHFNPKYSIATVSLTGKNMSASYKVDEEIESMARVTKIERKKLTFRNLNNNRNEYVEIPEDAAVNFGLQSNANFGGAGGNFVEQKGKFEFTVRRTDLDQMITNLPALLQQARMEPVFSPDGIGIEGYRFVNIQPGSPYEKLGFRIDDVIKSVNGEPVSSPQQAMQMFNQFRSSNFLQLGIEREGRDEKISYSIQ